MKNKFKHAHISIAATAVLLTIYTVIFNGNEDAMSVGGVLAMVFCLGLLFFLDGREYRARHSGRDDSD